MLRLVTVCRPAEAFVFLLWAFRRLYCHNSNNNKNIYIEKISTFVLPGGSGTCQPQGYPRAFASYVHFYSNMTKHGRFCWKHKKILSRTEKLVEFFKACLDFMSVFLHCLSSQKLGAIDVNRHIFFGYGIKFLLI